MPEDINELDVNDIGLKMVMGDRFHDETENADAVKITPKAENPAKAVKAPAIEPKIEPKDAKWCPVKPDPNWLDRLKECTKRLVVFGGLCVLFFYWQQTGQMEASAAVPSMCACCALAGVSVGKYSIKGERK